jgi:hypothetical protein
MNRLPRSLPPLLYLLFVMAGLCAIATVASADPIAVGDLTYDSISSTQNQFDITNLTGANEVALGDPMDFPISSPLTITVTDLTVNFTSGPSLVLPGSDFGVVDAALDVDCTAGACNTFGDSITSATLTGTFSPTTGLSGLPAGDTGILAAFTTTITPDPVNCTGGTLSAGCDTSIIYATGITGSGPAPVPEPGTVALLGSGMIGLLFMGYRRMRGADSGRISTTAF